MDHFRQMLQEPWAILPESLEALVAESARVGRFYEGPPPLHIRAARGAAQAVAGLFTSGGEKDDAASRPYAVEDGVAVIEITGVIVRRQPRWSWTAVSSMERLREVVKAALADGSARAILLDFDSPGGPVSGLDEMHAWLVKAAKQKPMYAYTAGTMTSGAFWLASACGDVTATPAARVGHVGVYTVHEDWSKWNEKYGIDPTWLSSGKLKTAGHPDAPLSDRDRAYLQERLDQVYDLFTNDVAKALGLDPAKHGEWADGQWFRGAAALELDLVARNMGREDLISFISQKEDKAMTKDTVTPDAASAAGGQDVAATAVATAPEEALAAARKEGVLAARDNVLGVVAAVLGDEAASAVRPLVESGLDAEQAKAVVQGLDQTHGQGADRQAILAAIDQDGAAADVKPGGHKPGKESAEAKTQALIDRIAKHGVE